ncbi:LysM peptidoglycan-binding domain-containing protein [Sulfitobacter maritimus]|uniref:LysM peptidoglycan-binding domain-containing protein n=1 Tax=Sulfitobacter maritimus TaxID=2741719 RepID=UPI001FEB7541|nr:LysM peptidoglycan-binding domain-containing protein [Sulfitobacter maritimus]
MFKGLGHAGGKTAMAAGAVAAAVLALGVWLGSKRDVPEMTQTVSQPRDSDGSETAMLAQDAVQGASVGPEGTAATEPKAIEPEATKPEATKPEATKPEATKPETTEPETTEPEGSELEAAEPEGRETEATEPEATKPEAVGPEASKPEATEAQTTEATLPPAFDEVRRDPDGMTVIAGRAAPGSVVTVLKDGKEVARATADGAGKFATLAMIPPDGEGHVLTLMGQDGDTQIASAEEIILAPIAAPIDTATADTSTPVQPSAPTAETPDAQEDDDIAIAALSDELRAEPAPPVSTPTTKEVTAPEPDGAAELSEPTSTVATLEEKVPAEDGPLASTTAPEVEAKRGSDGDAQADIATTNQTTAPASTVTAETDPVTENQAEKSQGSVAETPSAATEGTEPVPSPSGTAPSQQDAPAVETDTTTNTAEADPDIPIDDVPTSTAQTATTQTTPQTPEAVAAAPAKPDPAAPTGDTPDVTTPQTSADVDATTVPSKPSAPATAPVAVLKSTAEGVERIDTAPPQVMTNVALDTIGYSDQGDVQLAGRAQPETREVRVYLNNDAIISLPVDAQGRWRGDLPNVDEGIYTLRVDELSEGGDVTSRVETPFKRESPQTLAQASAGLTGPLGVVTVQKGDTLWAISRERYGDPFLYVKVFEANSDNIRDPDLIYPGQVFDLPETAPAE